MRLVALADSPKDAARATQCSDNELARALEDDGVAAAVYACELSGETVVTGAFQRTDAALNVSSCRRRTGGIAAFGGDGVSYVAMRLRHASVFMSCPHNRVLNRNVRGLLAGLSTSGVAAHYFGRDFVSIAHRPAVLTTWSRAEGGEVDLEFFVSVSRSFRADDFTDDTNATSAHFLGKTPITLTEAWGYTPKSGELIDRIARRGYAEKNALEYELRDVAEHVVSDAPEPSIATDTYDDLSWSQPHAIPIGELRAGVRTEGGFISRVAVAGDFMADAVLNARLETQLRGKRATAESFVPAVNEVFLREGLHVEGVASLQPVLEALLEAAREEEAAAKRRS